MSNITIEEVKVLNNPAKFTDEFKFEVTFNCVEKFEGDLEWKLIYVGSPDSEEHDQILDSILVGPVVEGKNKFVFSAPAPDANKIPKENILDVTVVLLSCYYKEKEALRVGFFVNNEYPGYIPPGTEGNEEGDKYEYPKDLDINKITRHIMSDKPRITEYDIDWK